MRKSNVYLAADQIEVVFRIQNLSQRDISGYQTQTTLSFNDPLGRTFSVRLTMNCEKPLHGGQTVTGAFAPNQFGFDIPDQPNCASGYWELNPYLGDDNDFATEAMAGNEFTGSSNVNEVSFSDGTSIGSATTGQNDNVIKDLG